MKIKKNINNKRILTIVGIIIVVAILASLGIIYYRDHIFSVNTPESSSSTDKVKNTTDTNTVDTPANNEKGQVTSGNNTNGQPNTNVDIVIVDASQYGDTVEVRAYANVVENGTCTYTFTHGEDSITKHTNAASGASTTSCLTLDIPVSEFTNGTWMVTVKYLSNSGKFSGSSSQRSITVKDN